MEDTLVTLITIMIAVVGFVFGVFSGMVYFMFKRFTNEVLDKVDNALGKLQEIQKLHNDIFAKGIDENDKMLKELSDCYGDIEKDIIEIKASLVI